MAYSITITNTNGLKYRFFDGEVQSSRYGIITKLFKGPLPESGAEDQIVINLGKDKVESAEFKLLETTEDASVGTHTSTVKTIQQKLTYIDDTFLTNGVSDLYTIDLETHTGSILSKKGIIDNFSFNFSNQNPKSLNGNFSFSLGGGQQNQ